MPVIYPNASFAKYDWAEFSRNERKSPKTQDFNPFETSLQALWNRRISETKAVWTPLKSL